MMSKVEVNAENFQKQLAITTVINSHLKTIEDETGLYSFPNPILKHPLFLELVQMGDKIVNYLFYLMFEYGSSRVILLLLDKIVKDKPVMAQDIAGKFYHQTVEWMKWYLESDYYKSNNVYFNLINNPENTNFWDEVNKRWILNGDNYSIGNKKYAVKKIKDKFYLLDEQNYGSEVEDQMKQLSNFFAANFEKFPLTYLGNNL